MANLLQQATQTILDALSTAAERSPLPEAETPPVTIPDESVPWSELLGQIPQVMNQSMNPAHPGYMGHMDPMPTVLSMVGDWVTAALNNNMLSVEMSPLFSRLEPLLMREIAQWFGLGDRAGGVLVSGGSLANLQALVVARNARLGVTQTGLKVSQSPVIFTSELAHTSVQKAAMVAGLGTAGVIPIAVNAQGQMEISALQEAIQQSRHRQQTPFALFATAGTTVTGNIDPLPQLAQIAEENNLWFHVDAAYGGAILFSPTQRHRLRGIERADSVTFNPQKWLYVTKTCASVMFRDWAQLDSHFRVAAPYMNEEATWQNLGEFTIQGTRHADVLKLWLTLQHLGKRGCAALVDASYDLTAVFVRAVQQRPFLRLATEPEMNIICFRGQGPDLTPGQQDQWNRDLQKYLLTQVNAFLSLPVYRGQRWLKAVLLNPFTSVEHIHQLFQSIDTFAHQTGEVSR